MHHLLTSKQQQVLQTLFQFRGLLFDQMASITAHFLQRENTKSFSQNLYKTVQKLEKEKYLVRDVVTLNHRMKHFIYLSELGLEYVYNILDVPPGKKGTGYNNDYGEFPYELHRPVSKVTSQNIRHHILLIDVLFETMKINGVSSRDNRYASVEYEWENKIYRFRPDGEIMFDNKIYLLEIDRHTESLENLKEKFAGYNRYFKWCQQNGKQLPQGVIVIIDQTSKTGYTRRWTRFLNAFFSEMKDWYLDFNLLFGTISDLKPIIMKEMKHEELYNKFVSIIKNYIDEKKGIKGLKYYGENTPIYCRNGGILFSITNDTKIFGYERFELYETRALARLYELYKYIKKNNITIIDFIPVFYSTHGTKIPLNFSGFIDELELEKTFSNPIWLQLLDEKNLPFPIWNDKDGNRIMLNNPLLL